MVDVNMRYHNRPVILRPQVFFGRLLHIMVVDVGPVPTAVPAVHSSRTFVLAAIQSCIEDRHGGTRPRRPTSTAPGQNAAHRIPYYKKLGSIEVVDIQMIKCVVGRVQDRGRFGIIDRSGMVPTVGYADED